MTNLEVLTSSLQSSVCQPKHVVVIGGSIAGLLSAKVLTKYFERVTVIERDNFTQEAEHRAGVPQSPHVHTLLKRGLQVLEELFPGIETQLADSGASSLDWGNDLPWLGFAGWAPRFNSGLITHTCSRNLLEKTIRQRLATENNLVFIQGGQVVSLLSSSDGTSVTGVRVRFRNQPETDFTADLVVDASGRNSPAPQWLEAMGYTPPQETVINSFLGYASCWYEPPTNLQYDWQCLYVTVQPPNNNRGGVIYKVEGNRWILTLIGVGKDYPPTDKEGFLDFARSLRSPAIYEAIKDAQPLSSIYGYRRTENRLRHYEKLKRFPEGFLLVGDAVCAFNPVYGQGMTVAALEALTLDQCLNQQLFKYHDGSLIGLSRYFQKELNKVIAAPWLMTTGEDLRWHTTEGGKSDFISRVMQRYVNRVLLLQTENAEIHKTFLEVIHMLKPPTAFFHPSISTKVLKRVMNWQRKNQQLVDEQDVPKKLSVVTQL
ncbi:MAG: FAD-dependent monooxygenase [Nostoc sp. ChiSLP02]|nr:FAD-dependent monooxygenase [Nostoc sp. DedSLP05]MDZ8102437.1 FAD-dependent monooxygenase [Nostoc sp. DedSLP01]MDZ8189430.1 FAD-dependent monooxygenase [Nostoc sp. ChiSLP02]